MIKLFTDDFRHHKMNKAIKYGYLSMIMHLAPADRSGYEVCPMRTAGCTIACLNTAGFKYARIQNARITRTKYFFEHKQEFMAQLVTEINNARRRAREWGLQLTVRLNGTSDIVWEKTPVYYGDKAKDAEGYYANIMDVFPDVTFMDYTKRHNRRDLPKNYHLTFSRSETNDAKCIEAIKAGMNIAVVFRDELPEHFGWRGMPVMRVIDGDEHDLRFHDQLRTPDERVVVGLRAKGKAKNDNTGFVIDLQKGTKIHAT